MKNVQTDSLDTNRAVVNVTTLRLQNGKIATYAGNYIWDKENEPTARYVNLNIDGVVSPVMNYGFKSISY